MLIHDSCGGHRSGTLAPLLLTPHPNMQLFYYAEGGVYRFARMRAALAIHGMSLFDVAGPQLVSNRQKTSGADAFCRHHSGAPQIPVEVTDVKIQSQSVLPKIG